MSYDVEGLEESIAELVRRVDEIEGKTEAGLFAGALIVQAEAQRRVPVEYGVLRASAFTQRSQANKMEVEVGFSAAYALSIHENLEQRLKGQPRPSGLGVFWGPHGQPKFLESAAADKADEVVAAVTSRVKL